MATCRCWPPLKGPAGSSAGEAKVRPQAARCPRCLLPWESLETEAGLGLGWLGVPAPFSASREDSLKSASPPDPPQFFSLSPQIPLTPRRRRFISLDSSLHSLSLSFFISPSPLNPFFLFKGKTFTAVTMSEQPQKVLGMPVSFFFSILLNRPDPLGREMPRVRDICLMLDRLGFAEDN